MCERKCPEPKDCGRGQGTCLPGGASAKPNKSCGSPVRKSARRRISQLKGKGNGYSVHNPCRCRHCGNSSLRGRAGSVAIAAAGGVCRRSSGCSRSRPNPLRSSSVSQSSSPLLRCALRSGPFMAPSKRELPRLRSGSRYGSSSFWLLRFRP